MTDSEYFTAEVSKYMNTFLNDLDKNKDKVLAKLETFKGENQAYIRRAIEKGPETLPQNDVEVCKSMFSFIVYYSTGKILPNLDVQVREGLSSI